jgi:proprotein convertase subtilisin/kexin type 5
VTCNGGSAEDCLSCKAGFFSQPSRACSDTGSCSVVECLCAKGCFSDMMEDLQCHSECDSCRNDNCTCKNCGSGMFMNLLSCSCYVCPQGCETCVGYDDHRCTSCKTGFKPSRLDSEFQCIFDSKCEESTCDGESYFDTEECMCKTCDFTCKGCYGPTNYECRECASSNFDTNESAGLATHCTCDSNCESSSIDDGTCDGEECSGDSGSSDSELSSETVIIIVASVVGSVVLS